MVYAQFKAVCPFEIGDKITDNNGNEYIITDIACIHYLRTQKVEFMYELNNVGGFIRLYPAQEGEFDNG